MSVWQIWWIALAIKTILLPIIPITPDEAYYLAWARHPALSYFDHPPFISLIMRTALPFWGSSFGIRWPGVLLSHIGFIPWFGILDKLKISKKAQRYWILAILFAPLTGLGAFIITPDVPLVFFWSIGVWALLWTMEKPSVYRWSLVGVACGLGLLSKYMMILFFPAALIWILWEHKGHELKKPGPWIAGVIALIIFYPVILWNMRNNFASFAFQTHHGLTNNSGFRWNWPLEYVFTELALLNPFFAAVGLWVIWTHRKSHKILLVFTAVPFIFFLLTSFRARVEANWPVCGYPSFLALVVTVVDVPNEFRKFGVWLRTGMRLCATFIIIVISHAVHPWLPIKQDSDHTYIMREWKKDVDAVKDLYPLYARSYQIAAFLSYFRAPDKEVFKLAGLDRTDFYDFLKESHDAGKGYMILKADDKLPKEVSDKYDFLNPKVLPSHLLVYELVPKVGS